MSFCIGKGFTIYVAPQKYSDKLKIFIQKGIQFKPLNDILYDPIEDIMEYHAAIDKKYEEMYNKMK